MLCQWSFNFNHITFVHTFFCEKNTLRFFRTVSSLPNNNKHMTFQNRFIDTRGWSVSESPNICNSLCFQMIVIADSFFFHTNHHIMHCKPFFTINRSFCQIKEISFPYMARFPYCSSPPPPSWNSSQNSNHSNLKKKLNLLIFNYTYF